MKATLRASRSSLAMTRVTLWRLQAIRAWASCQPDMRHKVAFDESVGCYFVEWTGTVEADNLKAFYHDIAVQTWFRPGLNGLHDFRTAAIVLDGSAISSTRRAVENFINNRLPRRKPRRWWASA